MKPSAVIAYVVVFAAGVPYWIGVLFGYYAAHRPYLNSNPNTWINAVVGNGLLVVIALLILEAQTTQPSSDRSGVESAKEGAEEALRKVSINTDPK